ncbi:MAG: hypothetical protein K940chlam6_01140 [Chlamydiae bacterium]|nr:hypothetical protein [Chlamydiota bacterium]
MSNSGILVAADEKLEWLLPWWWNRYSAHNNLPVAFVDFGLSHYGRTFCTERGEVIDCPCNLPLFSYTKQGETIFGKRFEKSWFKKPFACPLTPFETTLWLDIDCEVLQPLDSLFEREGEIHLAKETDAAIARDPNIAEGEVLYNSGVILYHRDSLLIKKWAEAVLEEGSDFWSDQHTLSRVITSENYPIHLLEEKYNWRMSQGLNIHAAIVHWVGSWGKDYIRHHGGIAEELAALPKI